MKSITLAVIFAGIVSYGTTYSPPAASSNTPDFAILAIDLPPLNADPDDNEEDRIAPRKKSQSKKQQNLS